MAQEIERKFLVKGNFKSEEYISFRIMQGYLSSVPERNVRVRVIGERGFITIKGRVSDSGMSRFEWEKEIPVTDALELLDICEPGVIEKTRFVIKKGKHNFEVDEFSGDNSGLVIAEVELLSEDEFFEKPEWLGVEVTGDPRYFNSMLVKKPYNQW